MHEIVDKSALAMLSALKVVLLLATMGASENVLCSITEPVDTMFDEFDDVGSTRAAVVVGRAAEPIFDTPVLMAGELLVAPIPD